MDNAKKLLEDCGFKFLKKDKMNHPGITFTDGSQMISFVARADDYVVQPWTNDDMNGFMPGEMDEKLCLAVYEMVKALNAMVEQ